MTTTTMYTSEINRRLATMAIGTTTIIGACTVTRVKDNGFIVRPADSPRLGCRTLGQDGARGAIETLND